MYKKGIILFITVLVFSICGMTPEKVFRTIGDTTSNYYIVSKPKFDINKVLLVLPGMGETPEQFLDLIRLDSLLVDHNTLLIVASPEGVLTHFLNSKSISIIDEMLVEIEDAYSLSKSTPLFLGGFSIGGTGALRYAQYVVSKKSQSNFTLKGVFTVDPPLDFEWFWDSMKRTIENNVSEVAVYEAKYMLDLMKANLGGAPKENYKNYIAVSPFTASQANGGSIALLENLPLRFYSEPDTLWWMKERGTSYEDLNSYIFDKLEKRVNSATVEVIRTKNKGYRSDGSRHPHSWSIVDEKELVEWINSL